jgi:hypothetical protein
VEASRPNVWQLQARHDVQGLIVALQSTDPEVRKRAAIALRMIDASPAVPALKRALQKETDESARKSLFAALYILDHQTDVGGLIKSKDVHGLVETLKSRHPENVITAAQALGELGDRTAVEPLVILFHNSSSPPKVRLAAAEALLQLKSAPAVVTLLGALRRDSWEVRRNAAAVLGQIQAAWAVDPLNNALDDPHPVVRRTAAAALRRIGTADAIAALRARFTTLPSGGSPAAAAPPDPAPATSAASVAQGFAPPVSSNPVPTSPAPMPEVAAPPPASPPASSGESIKLSEPAVTSADTVPIQHPADSPSAGGQVPPPERLGSVTQPVKKLIAFLKQRGLDKP